MMKAKKMFALICCLALAFTLTVPALAYEDTSGHWAADSIDTWTQYGVIEGDGTNFRPNEPITRGELAKVIATMLKLTEKAENTFTDLEGKWYADYVLACVKAGIVKGYEDNTFRGDKSISREEAFVMIARAIGVEPEETCDKALDDLDTVSSWAVGYINALLNKGYINGISDTLLAPDHEINRASVVKLLDNAISKYDPETGKFELAVKEEEKDNTSSGGIYVPPVVEDKKPVIISGDKEYTWDADKEEYYFMDGDEKEYVNMDQIYQDAQEAGTVTVDGKEYTWNADLNEWIVIGDDGEESAVIGGIEDIIGGDVETEPVL